MGSMGEVDEREPDNDADSSSDFDNAVSDAAVFPVIMRRFEPVPNLADRCDPSMRC
jgi:hypothetical protein